MKILRLVGFALLGLFGLVVLLYLAGLAINARDQPPTAAAMRLQAMVDEDRHLADDKNAFVYVLGFAAPSDDDVKQVGARRAAWLRALNAGSARLEDDPGPAPDASPRPSSLALGTLQSECLGRQDAKCLDAFETAAATRRNDLEGLQLTRYRELLRYGRWRDVVPQNPRFAPPPYGKVFNAQRLYFLDLRQRLGSLSPADIRTALDADLSFWRQALSSAGYMVPKLLAVAALRYHFCFGNLVLRQLPKGPSLEAAPQGWRQQFTREELSLLRTMSGELAFGEGTLRLWKDHPESLQGGAAVFPTSPFAVGVVSPLARPFLKLQDQKNYVAAQYESYARGFDIPLDQYPAAVDAVRLRAPPRLEFHVYNPVGHVFRSLADPAQWADYPKRIAAVEIMRRAALLTMELRARGVAKASIAGELSRAELRDPFEDAAFEWSAEDNAVIYPGAEADQRRRCAYFF